MVAVEPVTPAQYAEWSAYLASCEGPSAFLQPAWLDVLEGAYPASPRLFAVRDGQDQLTGGALVYHHAALCQALHSPPFGLNARTPAARTALLAALREHAEVNGIAASNLALGFVEPTDQGLHAWSRPSFLLDLEDDGDAFWQALPSKARNTIRKAQKQGIKIEIGPERLDQWYGIYADQCLAKRLTIHNERYFELLFEALGDDVQLVTGALGGQVIAGMIFLLGQPFAHYLFNAARPDALPTGVNTLLMLEFAEVGRAAGVATLELGESRPASGVYDFKKKQMGGEEVALYHIDLFDGVPSRRPSLKERIHYSARFVWPLLPSLAKRHNLQELKALHRLI